MKCLVYCVVRCGHPREAGPPAGIDGEPVRLAADQGLAAAFSQVAEREAAPNVARATAFARVVEAFHNAGTALPLRYGCLLDAPEQVVRLLRGRRAEFLAALSRLDGCVEMGLRILLPQAHDRPAPPTACGQASGRGYLALRGAHYAARDGADRQAADVAAWARAAFEGLYRESRLERPRMGLPGMVSLSFLLRRNDLACFRPAFVRFQTRCPHKAMVTGPWPPYSFSEASDGPAQCGCGAASMESAQEPGLPSAPSAAGLSPQALACNELAATACFPQHLAHPLL